MKNRFVSVIMPMHNSERFVSDAIHSVMRQTYQHWELIVVDDDSTDNSLAIARSLAEKDSRIRVIHNPHSTGLPGTPRNIGIQEAQGQYIAFLDSDDMWLPNKLAQQIPFFKNNLTAVVYSDYEKVDEHGHRSARIIKAPASTDYQQLLYSNVIGNLTGIFDVRKVGKRYFLPIHHEDYAFWLSVLKNGYIARSTQTLTALYRVRPDSLSSGKLRTLGWQWNILRNIEHISVLRSCIYFVAYAYRAFVKSLV